MATTRTRWAIGAALIALAISGIATAQQPPRPGFGMMRGGAMTPERREAMEVLRAFNELAGAVEAEETRLRAEGGSVDRPGKTVTPPTLTPGDLDALLDRSLAEAGTEPAPIADDETFVRRVFLDVVGAPPTEEQVRRFVASDDPAKRADLIDRLLDSDGYATNWARYWRDVIRYRATFQNPRLINYQGLEAWLAEQFAANRPWDEIATDLIAGTGRSREDGQVAFAAAHLDGRRTVSAPEFAGEVSRIFMGVQIQCAECHDHPTDPWTRAQFHEFAAFFAGTEARREGRPQDPDYGLEIAGTERIPRYTMADLEDPSTSIPITPDFFLASEGDEIPPGLSGQERRELAASYVVGQDNPWFARAFVNRVWSELMGEAFYQPVDDLGPARDPYAPEVIDALAEQWQAGGYDVKWLYRTILNTEAYQRASRSSTSAAGRTPFASNCPGPLRADQIVDAIDRALGLVTAARRNAPAGDAMAMRRARFGPRFFLNQLFGVDPSTPSDEVLGTIPQALFLMNARPIEQAIAHPRGVLTGLLDEHPGDAEALDALYLRVLSRSPNDEETHLCLDHLAEVGDRREGFEDILWALINSSEFISRR